MPLTGRAEPTGPRGSLRQRLHATLRVVLAWLTRHRVREHLRRTERALRVADTSHLDEERHRRRMAALDALRAYRQQGAVPTNRSVPERAPQFVGADGVPCAVAAMLRADGRTELVERVAATDNAVRLEDVEDGPLVEWLDETGLTRAEAARIQPTYPSEVQFVTDCGPVGCALARTIATVAGVGAAAVAEYVGYRLVGDRFPANPLKRRAWLAYVTVLNLLLAPLLGVVVLALFP
jgi:hypothetical protein